MAAVCDLVLLTWNRPDLLIPAMQRILQHTTIPSRLIIVDNASTDPKALECLQQVQGTDAVEVLVIRRTSNDGFAKGMNDGLARTTAPWICLLNNDILVTEGWLEEMLAVATANPHIGLLNPMSNEFNVEPQDVGETVDALARRRQSSQGRWIENWFGVGFCLLFSRETFQQVGTLDAETFQFMYSEDKDYSFRVRRLGRLCAIAEGAYVYHRTGSTAQHHPERWRLFQANEDRFYRKWGVERPRRIAYVLNGHDEVSEVARERIRQLANTGHRVWVLHPTPRGGEATGIPRHFHVVPQRVGRVGFWPRATGRILFKKKKFHRIILPPSRARRLFRWLKPIHQADVVDA